MQLQRYFGACIRSAPTLKVQVVCMFFSSWNDAGDKNVVQGQKSSATGCWTAWPVLRVQEDAGVFVECSGSDVFECTEASDQGTPGEAGFRCRHCGFSKSPACFDGNDEVLCGQDFCKPCEATLEGSRVAGGVE